MRYLLGIFLFVTVVSGAEAVNPSPEEIEYEKVTAQAKAEYDAKVNAAKKKLLIVLESRKKEVMLRGNLAMANYLDKKIKSLASEKIKLIWPSGQVVLLSDGQALSPWGDGTWSKDDDVYNVSFGVRGNQAWKHKIKLDKQKMSFNSIREDNEVINGTFIIEN